MKKMRLVVLLLLTVLLETGCAVSPLPLSAQEYQQRQTDDSKAVQVYRAGIARLVAYTQEHIDLFPARRLHTVHLLSENQRDSVRKLWSSLLDYYILLDSIRAFHTQSYLLSGKPERLDSFQIARSAFLAEYRFALEFIQRVENDPNLPILLNDAVADLVLPAYSYDKFKFRFLNILAATQFTAYNLLAGTMPDWSNTVMARLSASDAAYIWQTGKGKGEVLTLANAANVLKKMGFRLFFPIQAGVSEWMGDSKIWRQNQALISPLQIEALRLRLEPGDIMLQRREWYISNVGLPGFWSHAALYIGTAEERHTYFDTTEVQGWVMKQGEPSGEFESLLERDSISIYSNSSKPQEHENLPRVLEAISEGVSFTSLEHSAAADAIVILRPRLNRLEKAQALRRAFTYSGRPYDFNFDFQTDSALVCTELIYKAYEPAPDFRGIQLQLEEIAGRTAIPANLIARQFDNEFGTRGQQFDMVVFLDGQEKRHSAIEENVTTFRQSWRRPKWYVFTQKTSSL